MEEITYLGFCALGGLTNPRLSSSVCYNGTHRYIKYYMRRW